MLRMILVNLTTQPRADRASLPSLEMGWDPFNINFGLFASLPPDQSALDDGWGGQG